MLGPFAMKRNISCRDAADWPPCARPSHRSRTRSMESRHSWPTLSRLGLGTVRRMWSTYSIREQPPNLNDSMGELAEEISDKDVFIHGLDQHHQIPPSANGSCIEHAAGRIQGPSTRLRIADAV
jgi:hypothetical protein